MCRRYGASILTCLFINSLSSQSWTCVEVARRIHYIKKALHLDFFYFYPKFETKFKFNPVCKIFANLGRLASPHAWRGKFTASRHTWWWGRGVHVAWGARGPDDVAGAYPATHHGGVPIPATHHGGVRPVTKSLFPFAP